MEVADSYVLEQNYPNPFNPSTTIEYYIPQTSNVLVSIYNINGQKIDEVVNRRHQSGYYKIKWDATNFCSGIYFYQIKSENFQQVKKCFLIR